MRDMAFDYPNMEPAVLCTLEHVVTPRYGQASKHALDLLHGGCLQRDDRGQVVHDTRIAKHALNTRLGEPIENGVQHLHTRRVGEDSNAAILREGIEVEIACVDRLSVENTRLRPRRIRRK